MAWQICRLAITTWNGVQFRVVERIAVDWPEVRYQQGERATCVFNGMASALHFMGMKNTASKLNAQARNSLKQQENRKKIELIVKVLQANEPHLLRQKKVYTMKKPIDPLVDRSGSPTLMILESIDGACNHSVTVVGNWIFDSNEERALPLCIEALNKCAPPGYVGVVYGVRFGSCM
jgi:hypothetical protein